MSKEKLVEKFLENIPINELYKDLFKPGMKKAGEALSTVIDGANLILLPLKLINSKSRIYFDNNIKKYSDKINSNSTYTLTQVPQYVGLPILDKLTYLNDNDLSETFINLLTKASFEETLKFVHPSYLSILDRLSADEAKILFHYKNQDNIPHIDLYIHKYIEKYKKPVDFDKKKTRTPEQLTAMINYTTQNKESLFIKYAQNLTAMEKQIELIFPENIQLYLENLELNGIIRFERKLHNKNYLQNYDDLINKDYNELYKKLKENLKKITEDETQGIIVELDVRKGYIEFTELGKGFINACIKDIE